MQTHEKKVLSVKREMELGTRDLTGPMDAFKKFSVELLHCESQCELQLK